TVRARIGLFLEICDAVGYAHRRLVVHRDLKPANILVAAGGQIQLVDFGIAKILAPDDAPDAPDAGLSKGEADETRTGARWLTPNYASPEQWLGQPVTTLTDVWALGVLLFELLSGQRPFRWGGLSPLQVERQLAAGPPPRASRAATAGGDAEGRAARRLTDPARLERQLRGDLDAVLRRALAVDPERRYPSVEALAQDLGRYLERRPVHARSGWGYRLRAGLRRNAVAAATVTAVFALLVAFVLSLSQQSRRLTLERDLARQERDKAELMTGLLSDVLDLADPTNRDLNPAVVALLDRGRSQIEEKLASEPELRADLLRQVGNIYRRLGDFDRAEGALLQALESLEGASATPTPLRGRLLDALGFVYHQKRDPRAPETLRRAARELRAVHRGDHPDLAEALFHLSMTRRYRGDVRSAEALLRQAHGIDRRLGLLETGAAGDRLSDLAAMVGRRGDRDEALRLFDRAIAIQRAARGPESVQEALSLNKKSLLFQERPLAGEGAALLERAIAIFERRLGPDHPLVAAGHHNLAHTYLVLGDYRAAEAAERRALAKDTERLGPNHPSTLEDRHSLALILRAAGRLDGAESELRAVMAAQVDLLPRDHPRRLMTHFDLARVVTELGRAGEARRILGDLPTAAASSLGDDHWVTGAGEIAAAEVELAAGRPELALVHAQTARRLFATGEVGRERWRLGEAKSALGEALAQLDRPREAEPFLRDAARSLGDLRGPAPSTRRAEDRLRRLEGGRR
ncbi:MAG: serine/threonine-protein kinase, partial [Acidobacteriota bacterium]